jgi:hypothetical protein
MIPEVLPHHMAHEAGAFKVNCARPGICLPSALTNLHVERCGFGGDTKCVNCEIRMPEI